MNAPALVDLSKIGRGFSDLALDSQAAFRQVLAAIAQPGEIQAPALDVESPDGLHPAAAVVLLALLDQDTRLWLSPSLAGGVAGPYLRFHTGCLLGDHHGTADFLLCAAGELPPLRELNLGSEEYPERSATVVLQVAGLSGDAGWRLSGPGIDGESRLRVAGLQDGFLDGWREAQLHFPRGVDVIFAGADRFAVLPRTTKAEA